MLFDRETRISYGKTASLFLIDPALHKGKPVKEHFQSENVFEYMILESSYGGERGEKF